MNLYYTCPIKAEYMKRYFGDSDSGMIPLSIDAGAVTIRRGCSLFVSTTSGYLTAPVSNQWCIRATYK